MFSLFMSGSFLQSRNMHFMADSDSQVFPLMASYDRSALRAARLGKPSACLSELKDLRKAVVAARLVSEPTVNVALQ